MHRRHSIRVIALFFALVLLALPVGGGTHASEPDSAAVERQSDADACPPCPRCPPVDGEEGVGETEEDDGPVCHGILTCTFWGIGQVLAVPFKLIGGALRIII